jgi:hypothetical protein
MHQQRERQLKTALRTFSSDAPLVPPSSISTNQIMRAVQQQKRITDQLDTIRQQQQLRIARMRTAGAIGAALGFFMLSSIPLLFLAVAIIQTNLALNALSFLNGIIDVFIVMGEYLQGGLTLITRNNMLLSGTACVVVVMMGMWLRLMRTPQEA